MLNSVQSYIQGLLNGLASPQMAPLQAVIMPPVDIDAASAPIAYIWAGRGAETRDAPGASAPRPIGWQQFVWNIDVAVVAVMEIDDINVETAFPLLIDQITALMNTTTIPQSNLLDPVTGFSTQLVSLGERLTIDYARVRTTGTEGEALVKFGADVSLHVEELVSYGGANYYLNPTG